jgi:hypothetical protein
MNGQGIARTALVLVVTGHELVAGRQRRTLPFKIVPSDQEIVKKKFVRRGGACWYCSPVIAATVPFPSS